VLDSAKDDDRI